MKTTSNEADIVINTDFVDSKTIVMPDGNTRRLQFVKVPAHKRDSLVRIYLKSGRNLFRIGTGRHTPVDDDALITFTSGLSHYPQTSWASALGKALTQVGAVGAWDLILKVRK